MEVSMSQELRNYTKALYRFDAVVQQVPPDAWDAGSPCDGWCARDVVAHAAGVMNAVETMARTGANALPETPDPGDDPVGLWNRSRDSLLEALDRPGALDQRGNFWFGESAINDILAFSVWDPLGHAWDLAQATGLDVHGSDDVAEASMAVIGANADMLRRMGLMGDPVAVADDAAPYIRFLALTGRDPSGLRPSDARPPVR
jgi:uncharacterized protein (TIGR03086 family)